MHSPTSPFTPKQTCVHPSPIPHLKTESPTSPMPQRGQNAVHIPHAPLPSFPRVPLPHTPCNLTLNHHHDPPCTTLIASSLHAYHLYHPAPSSYH
ncbi:hypothetical protein PIB30_081475, partial [Stylosanthes scabra]|nr:hypothetical protein [Stylosanthes scabra]